jgi:tRNA(fMet)-specific endonuclease VapC
VRQRLERAYPDGIAVSIVSVAELEYGSLCNAQPDRHRALWRRFLEPFPVQVFDDVAAVLHAGLRRALRHTPISERDLLIAAIARAHDLTVVTHNGAEFARVPGLATADWL